MPRQAGKDDAIRLPVLPARDAVHFPGVVTTIHVLRDRSLKAVRSAVSGSNRLLVFSQRDMSIEDPKADDLCKVGVESELLQSITLPDGSLRVALRGLCRVRAESVKLERGAFVGTARHIEEPAGDPQMVEAVRRLAIQKFEAIVRRNKLIPPEALQGVIHAGSPGDTFDAVAYHLPLTSAEKQQALELASVLARGEFLLESMQRELQILEVAHKIEQDVEAEVGESQREFYLREQLRVIQQELERRENRQGESERYRGMLDAARPPSHVRSRIESELDRLDRLPPGTQEGAMLRQYLDTVLELPWRPAEESPVDLTEAKAKLESHHSGLERIKERLLEFVAVRNRVRGVPSPVLCFVGPPGVGKTTFARSLADALDRPLVRISLGGLRDEAEIRGHRRTYVGAMPGRVISAIRAAGVANPVVLLDEIDKMAGDGRGAPEAALLEVLDVDQQASFTDHFLDLPFDLRHVTFVATANRVDRLPAPLRDRLEVIEFPNYTETEKLEIARRHLWPDTLGEHGLSSRELPFDREAALSIIRRYTREAGVRELKRQLAVACRKRALGKRIHWENLETILGPAPYAAASGQRPPQVGVVTGLVVSEAGGATLTIEAVTTPMLGSAPELVLTGSLGDVMRESAQTALTLVRSELSDEAIRRDLHLHLPEAAIPKEGPSAGLALAIAIRSALTQVPVRADIAFTGEITIRGNVLAVGGIRDKALAAQRDGYTVLVLPTANAAEVAEIPDEVKNNLRIELVARAAQAYEIAF